MNAPELSLVVSTLGRSSEIVRLFDSLAAQTFKNFEVIVVDQNDDDRLAWLTQSRVFPFPVQRVHRPGTRGLSRGRNVGWPLARGIFVAFPDDDCWYPPSLFERALANLKETSADMVCGRAADETGRSINGRFQQERQIVTRRTTWTCLIEWMMFVRLASLQRLGGYDETIGVGADSPWQSAEGQELLLRAISADLICLYDPNLYGHHAEWDTTRPDESLIRKGRAYGRGMGHVLRKSQHGPLIGAYWTSRACANAAIAMLKLNWSRTRYYGNIAIGRWEGYFRPGLTKTLR